MRKDLKINTGLISLLLLLTTSCSGLVNSAGLSQPLEMDELTPNVEFNLKTETKDGKMVYIGVGGVIDGLVNPDLYINLGEIVRITLMNNDGVTHDLFLEELNINTGSISNKGDTVEIIFKISKDGTYTYFCTLPGHRQTGMEGRLIVGDKPETTEMISRESVVRSPNDLPGNLDRDTSEKVLVELETIELEARLDDGTSYKFWTFNGKVPGPFIRVRVGDHVEIRLKNNSDSDFSHSVDFHAVTGPGGGAVATQTLPGEETGFSFKALNPGLYVYHCATPMVAHHIANGMYGLIMVEPEEGLPPVDHEFYVMQGEIYSAEPLGTKGLNTFDVEKLLDEQPEYFIFNGSTDALTAEFPLEAEVGDTVRILFGVGGPNFISSFHVIGEIFDRVYNQASLTSDPLTNVQTTLVAPGGATMVEFTLQVPGRYLLVDHALSRLERGLIGYLEVTGPENAEIFQSN